MGTIFKLMLACLFLSSCSAIIYQPDKYLYATPEQFNVKYEAFTIPSLDGTKLSAWRMHSKKKDPKNLVLYFHGNAQNLTSHFVNSVWMMDHDYDSIIFDYRGYGLSEGKPEPKGVAEDGLAFLNYAYEEYKKGGFKRFIVYGQSLGGAILLKSLEGFQHREEIALLVLDSTFLSPQEVAREKTFWPLSLIITNSSTADPKLTHLTMPVLSIHSTKDFVIAYELGQKLYDRITTSPKKEFWSFDVRGHGDVFYVENKKYQTEFIKYVNSLP